MKSRSRSSAIAAILATVSLTNAQVSPYSIDSTDAIKQATSTMVWDLLQYYKGNLTGGTPGILPGPPPAGDYYWWEGGAMWGTLIDYWHLTGDATYNDEIMQAIQHQTGENNDFMPKNYTASLGNDDQGFWGLTAMLAAEENFPNPPTDRPGWLALAQAVFNTQAAPDRHDGTCGGGIRWQIPFSNNGYNYKNSIANGCFFNLGARLARYTKNTTYSDWAEKQWDWISGVGLMSPEGAIYDGGHVENNCTDINKAEFSYNNAVWLQGAAFMYNYTNGDQKWKDRVDLLITHGLEYFFPDGIMIEPSCEDYNTCTTDMLSFKGYVHRWWSVVTQVAPYTAEKILPVLKTSAAAAVKQCTGGAYGRQCGFKWASGSFATPPGTGAGQQMNVIGAASSLLIGDAKPPVTNATGGTSKGNPDAGAHSDNFQAHEVPVTTGDKAGAGIITFLILGSACGMFGWMSLGA